MAFIDRLEKIVDSFFRYIPRSKPRSAMIENLQLIAHRGAFDHKKQCIENTKRAFQRALDLGCFGIELDIHETKDKVWVVNHDPDLKRLWNKTGHIKELSFQQLRALEPEILSLEEVVTLFGKKLHLFIEIKHPVADETRLREALTPLDAVTDYHLLGLEEDILLSLGQFPQASLMLVPIHNNVSQFCKLSLEKNYGGVLAHYVLLSLKQKQALLDAKQSVGVGFVNSKFSLYREVNRGHRWLFTNAAEEVVRCMNAIKK